MLIVEEQSVIGGLGGAAAEAFADASCRGVFKRIGLNEVFSQSGSYADLLNFYGLTSNNITEEVKRLLKRF